MYSLNIRLTEQANGDEIVNSITNKFKFLKLEFSYRLLNIFTFQNFNDFDIEYGAEYNNSLKKQSTPISRIKSEELIGERFDDAAFYIKCIGDILQNDEDKIESISVGPFDLEMALTKKCESKLE
ncbi:MAG: hypothetical protein MHPSP_003000 [Paramarteilia canceri]